VIQTCFAQIKVIIDQYAATSFVLDAKVSFEARPGEQGYLSGSVTFADSSIMTMLATDHLCIPLSTNTPRHRWWRPQPRHWRTCWPKSRRPEGGFKGSRLVEKNQAAGR
jgi:hypothetical protein